MADEPSSDAPPRTAPPDASESSVGVGVIAEVGTTAGARPDPLPAGGRITVLVVDDEAVIRALVARGLSLANFDVATAASGKEALRLVADGRVQPAVLVTDIDMPEMNGVELAARLLALRPAIRVVMMTGDAERADSARRHPSIVDAVLLKPMRIEELVHTVSTAAGQTLAR